MSDTTGVTYSYDAAGNLVGTSAGDSFVYDDYGRMVSASVDGVSQVYGYDAADVRVTVDGVGQLWDRSGGLPSLVSTGAGDSYVHAGGVARDGDDWLLADAVGSVRVSVDASGATVGQQDFSVFGESLVGSGSFGFAGEQTDPTGLVHLRARQYDPALGRFSSVDPVQPGGPGTTGWNLYAYAGNNPTTWTDPSGRAVLSEYATVLHEQSRTVALAASLVLFSQATACLSFGAFCPPSVSWPNLGTGNGEPSRASDPPVVLRPAPQLQPSPLPAEAAAVASTLLSDTEVVTRLERVSPECGEIIFHYGSVGEGIELPTPGYIVPSVDGVIGRYVADDAVSTAGIELWELGGDSRWRSEGTSAQLAVCDGGLVVATGGRSDNQTYVTMPSAIAWCLVGAARSTRSGILRTGPHCPMSLLSQEPSR